MAIPVLECRALSKNYGSFTALSNFNLSLPAGRIIGLLGPNGSGKRSGATAGDKQPAARNRQWTTTNKRRAMNDGRRKGRCKGRCNEDRQDCGVRRQKNRPAQPQARRHGPKAGIQYLFLLAQNTHRNVENRRIVQRNHASVRPRLEMDTHAFFRLVFPSEIVADGVYIDS